jgi:hypothetical protein
MVLQTQKIDRLEVKNMKKFTALFTIVALLVCMFTFAPAASAAEMYGPDGETVYGSDTLRHSNGSVITISFELECNNGWLDGTNGVDYVRASMESDYSISCSASIDLTANYIQGGSYTSDSSYRTTSTLGSSPFSLSIYPDTDLLSSGYADFEVEHASYGTAGGSLSASCPTAVK